MIFEYKIKLEDESIVQGEIEGPDEALIVETLSRQGTIISLRKKRKKIFQEKFFRTKIKHKDLIVFTRQLAIMLSANFPLVRALETLLSQTTNQNLKEVVNEIVNDTKGGTKLSTSLSKFPQFFSPFFINMVKSGETVGKLDEVLNYLADEQEKDYEFRSKIKGALIYPLFIITLVIIVMIVMMTFIIPQLSTVFLETGAQLPLSTRVLINLSNFMVRYWWLIFSLFGGAFFLFTKITKKGKGKKFLDRIQIKIPIIGELFQKIYLIQFSRSFSTLISGGVTLPEALKIVGEVMPNSIYKEIIEATLKEVNEGRSIATIFSQRKEVPPILSQMLVVGEQAGQIEMVLNKIANFYTREVEILISRLTNLIEPLIIMLLGLGVAFIVSGIILPIYNLASGGF
ncbi:MAG: type II secretion system F family protein [Patescibacteria group bacterium]|nr:type II secretion system F family protein [Patescibacteria group bacterium]